MSKIKVDCKKWYNMMLTQMWSGYFECKGSPGPGPTPEPTGPAVDPNPSKYTQEYMDVNSHFEECGIQENKGIQARYSVYIPSRGCWWTLASLGIDHVKVVAGELIAEDFTKDGYRYHVYGFSRTEPTNQVNPALDVTGSKCSYTGDLWFVVVKARTDTATAEIPVRSEAAARSKSARHRKASKVH